MKQSLFFSLFLFGLFAFSGAEASEFYRPMAVCRGVDSDLEVRIFQNARRFSEGFAIGSLDNGRTVVKAEVAVIFDAEGYPNPESAELGLKFQLTDEDSVSASVLINGQVYPVLCSLSSEI